MTKARDARSGLVALAALALLASAPGASAQTPTASGRATAMQATVTGPLGPTTTALGSTGGLVDDGDARTAALLTGSIPSVGGANVLHAATISSIEGWNPGEDVTSEASLADLVLTVAGNAISASFAMAQARAPVGAAATGSCSLQELAVNGVPIATSGAESQTVSIPGLRLVINEVQRTASGITVNGLHVTTLDGAVDVVVASATAAIGQ